MSRRRDRDSDAVWACAGSGWLRAEGDTLHQRGIFYAPDFLINAGGIASCAREYLGGVDDSALHDEVAGICDRVLGLAQRIESTGACTRGGEVGARGVVARHRHRQVWGSPRPLGGRGRQIPSQGDRSVRLARQQRRMFSARCRRQPEGGVPAHRQPRSRLRNQFPRASCAKAAVTGRAVLQLSAAFVLISELACQSQSLGWAEY